MLASHWARIPGAVKCGHLRGEKDSAPKVVSVLLELRIFAGLWYSAFIEPDLRARSVPLPVPECAARMLQNIQVLQRSFAVTSDHVGWGAHKRFFNNLIVRQPFEKSDLFGCGAREFHVVIALRKQVFLISLNAVTKLAKKWMFVRVELHASLCPSIQL